MWKWDVDADHRLLHDLLKEFQQTHRTYVRLAPETRESLGRGIRSELDVVWASSVSRRLPVARAMDWWRQYASRHTGDARCCYLNQLLQRLDEDVAFKDPYCVLLENETLIIGR